MDEDTIKILMIIAAVMFPAILVGVAYAIVRVMNFIENKHLVSKKVITEGFTVTAYYRGGDFVRYRVDYNGTTYSGFFDSWKKGDPNETSFTIYDYGKYTKEELRLSSYDEEQLEIRSNTVAVTANSNIPVQEAVENGVFQN